MSDVDVNSLIKKDEIDVTSLIKKKEDSSPASSGSSDGTIVEMDQAEAQSALPDQPPADKSELQQLDKAQGVGSLNVSTGKIEFAKAIPLAKNVNISKIVEKQVLEDKTGLFDNEKNRESYARNLEKRGYDYDVVRKKADAIYEAKNGLIATNLALTTPAGSTPENLYRKATYSNVLGKFDDAIDAYDRLLHNPEAQKDPNVWIGAANAYAAKGDNQKAQEYIRNAKALEDRKITDGGYNPGDELISDKNPLSPIFKLGKAVSETVNDVATGKVLSNTANAIKEMAAAGAEKTGKMIEAYTGEDIMDAVKNYTLIGAIGEDGKLDPEKIKSSKYGEPLERMANVVALGVGAAADAVFGAMTATPGGVTFLTSVEALDKQGISSEAIMQPITAATKMLGGDPNDMGELSKNLIAAGDVTLSLLIFKASEHMIQKGIDPKEATPAQRKEAMQQATDEITANEVVAKAQHPDDAKAETLQKEILDLHDDKAKLPEMEGVAENLFDEEIKAKTQELDKHMEESANTNAAEVHATGEMEQAKELEKVMPALSKTGKKTTQSIIDKLNQLKPAEEKPVEQPPKAEEPPAEETPTEKPVEEPVKAEEPEVAATTPEASGEQGQPSESNQEPPVTSEKKPAEKPVVKVIKESSKMQEEKDFAYEAKPIQERSADTFIESVRQVGAERTFNRYPHYKYAGNNPLYREALEKIIGVKLPHELGPANRKTVFDQVNKAVATLTAEKTAKEKQIVAALEPLAKRENHRQPPNPQFEEIVNSMHKKISGRNVGQQILDSYFDAVQNNTHPKFRKMIDDVVAAHEKTAKPVEKKVTKRPRKSKEDTFREKMQEVVNDKIEKLGKPSLAEIKSKVIEKVPEAQASAKKEGVPLKIQKDDLLSQINRARLLVEKNLPDDMIEATLKKEGFETATKESPGGEKNLQVVFDVEGDGQFRLNAKYLDEAYKDVERHWKINESPSSGGVRLGGKKLESGTRNVPDAKTYPEAKKIYDDAIETLKSAQKGGDEKVIKFFAEAANYAKTQMESMAKEEKVEPEYAKPTTYDSEKPTTDKHYINIGGIRFEAVKGKDVPNKFGADIFVHETKDNVRPFVVTEGRSGLEIASGETEIAATKKALALLKDRGMELFNSKIKEKENEFGTSPRYAPNEAKQKAKNQIADGVNGIINKLGAKKNLLPEEQTKLYEDLKNIVEGTVKLGEVTLKEAIQDIIEHIKNTDWYKKFTEKDRADVDAVVEKLQDDLLKKEYATPEETKMANAVNDAYVEGKFGKDALDSIMGKLAGTDMEKFYSSIKEKLEKGLIKTDDVRKRVMKDGHGSKEDQAALLYDMAVLKGREADLTEKIKSSTDEKAKSALQKELLDVNSAMMDNALANRMIGRDWYSIGKLRQVWVDKSASLDEMMNRYQASKGLDKLTAEQQEYVRSAYLRMREMEAKVDQARKDLEQANEKVDMLEEENKALKALSESSKEQRRKDRGMKAKDAIQKSNERISKAKDKLRALRSTMSSGVNPDVAVEIGKIAAEKVYQGAVKLDEVVRNVLDEIKDIFPHFTEQDIKDHLLYKKPGTPKSEQSKILSKVKQTAKIEARREAGDYESAKREVKEKSDALKAAEEEYARERYKWDMERRQDLLNKRPVAEKIADAILMFQRFNVLSYPSTIIKLLAVVGHGMVLKPFRFAVQALAHGATTALGGEGITSKQAIWGKPRLESLAAYYRGMWESLALENLKQQFKGIDMKEILYGKPYIYDEFGLSSLGTSRAGKVAANILETPGRSHGYIKSFIKHSEFRYAEKQITEHYLEKTAEIDQKLSDPNLSDTERSSLEKEKQQYNITSPEGKRKVGILATEHGKWSILMNDNNFTDKFRVFLDSSGWTGKVLRTDFPIIKIPLNYVGRSFVTKYGLIQALTGKKGQPGIIKLMMHGTKDLTPEQAEWLGKTINQGTIGVSMFALGYLLKHQMQENDDGSWDVAGVHVPKNLAHIPEYESLFSGVHTAHEMEKLEDADVTDFLKNVIISDADIVRKNPFLTSLKYGFMGSIIQDLYDNKKDPDKLTGETAKILGRWISGISTPGWSKQIAEGLDKPDVTFKSFFTEDATKRASVKTASDWEKFWQQIELGIPGLRENVPIKETDPFKQFKSSQPNPFNGFK